MISFFGIDEANILLTWPRLSMAVTIFYTIAHILPANLLRCYIFRRYLRCGLPAALGGLCLLIAVEAACQLIYPKVYSTRISFVFYFLYFLYFCCLIRLSILKQFTLSLPIGMTLFLVQNLAYLIEFTWPLFPIPFLESGLLVLLGMGLLFPLFRIYKEKLAIPLMADQSLTHLWADLTAMGAATLLLSILSNPFHEEHTLTIFLMRFFAMLGALAGLSIAFYAARQVIRQRQMNAQLAIMQEMCSLEKEHYEKIAQVEKNTQIIQQELSGYAEHIRHLLDAKDDDGIRQYSRTFLSHQPVLSARRLSNNELVNAIVNYWQGQLDQLQVKSSFNIILGRENPIDPLHMTAILGNLMRNAAEALSHVRAQEDRILRLSLIELGGMLIFTVDNSFNGEIHQDGQQQYLSTKRGFAARGIGLDSIRHSIRQYQGTLETKIEDHLFEVSIMIPLPSEKNTAAS